MDVRLHADDMGLSPDSDAIFLECIDHGACRSVSLLPNGDNFDQAAAFLADRPEVSVSVHLNLMEGCPLSPTDNHCRCVDHEGMFALNFGKLWLAATFSKESQEWLSNEMDMQIARVRDALGPSRALTMDGHVHTHMLPPIFRMLPDLAARHDIHAIRVPYEPLPFSAALKNLSNLGLVKNLLLNVLSLQNCSLPRRSSCVIGVLNTGKMTRASINADLIKCKGCASVEVILHPAYIDSGPGFYSNRHRLIEAQLLKNPPGIL